MESFDSLSESEKESKLLDTEWSARSDVILTNEWVDKCKYCLDRELKIINDDKNQKKRIDIIAVIQSEIEAKRPV
jgi:hypothetical protein